MNDATLLIAPAWVLFASGLGVPIITALVTRYQGSTSRKQAVVALALSAVLAVIAALTDNVPQDTVGSLAAIFLASFVPALAAYLGFWQPVVDVNAKLAPTKGI